MTTPVGPLPGQGDLSDKFVPVKSVAFTHGGSDMDLTDEATNGLAPCALTLYITTSGNLVAVLAGDVGATPYSTATAQTYPVVAGQELQGAFVLLKGSSTANCIARR